MARWPDGSIARFLNPDVLLITEVPSTTSLPYTQHVGDAVMLRHYHPIEFWVPVSLGIECLAFLAILVFMVLVIARLMT